ncbi:hypothetical protein PhaeoP48_01404 [Phaeobacter inhibens]|nr:hypothetical protein PhaeoP48_01404 [Phaeobacter inhibens]
MTIVITYPQVLCYPNGDGTLVILPLLMRFAAFVFVRQDPRKQRQTDWPRSISGQFST